MIDTLPNRRAGAPDKHGKAGQGLCLECCQVVCAKRHASAMGNAGIAHKGNAKNQTGAEE